MTESELIFNSRNILLQLLEKQNYNINDYKHFNISESFIMYNNNQLDLLMEKQDIEKDDRKIYVKYYLKKMLNKSQNIYDIVDELFNLEEILTKKDTLIIIIMDDPSDNIKQTISDIWNQQGIFIIIHTIKRLQYNILNHIKVPKHTVLSNEEMSKIKKQFNILDDANFPEISRFEPVAVSIGIRPGELCEIERSSSSAITSKYWRLCID
jgi:DNA-directed RNA polymerase subunit H (RpoH/RPB5)